jgi:hypothetical protein
MERRDIMSGRAKSKTDVAARSSSKNMAKLCSLCGNRIEVIMAVSSTGKKSMKRLCCED